MSSVADLDVDYPDSDQDPTSEKKKNRSRSDLQEKSNRPSKVSVNTSGYGSDLKKLIFIFFLQYSKIKIVEKNQYIQDNISLVSTQYIL